MQRAISLSVKPPYDACTCSGRVPLNSIPSINVDGFYYQMRQYSWLILNVEHPFHVDIYIGGRVAILINERAFACFWYIAPSA